MADESGRKPWPVWSRAQGYEALARYVSVESLAGLDLVDADASDRHDTKGAKRRHGRRTKSLYERLVAKRYRYQLEPWALEGQHIRDAGWIDRSGGTCIDFAVLFATMCVDAGLAPLIAIREVDGALANHAFVLVDIARQWERRMVPHPALLRGYRRFETGLPPDLVDALDTGDIVAIDPTRAARQDAMGYTDAAAAGRALCTEFAGLTLVDVLAVHEAMRARDELPLPAPPKDAPVISRFLPPFPEFTAYDSRQEDLATVSATTGRLVLWGAQGTGKSMLAHHVAASRAGGCGWFLSGTDASSLVTSLAMAHARENGLTITDLSDADRREYASTAVRYLEAAPEPWAVVVDNANGDPAELAPWLPNPSSQRGQLLIVTTTNEAWADVPRTRDLELLALSDSDVASDIGRDEEWAADLVRLARGRPLLSKSFGRLVTEVGRIDVEGLIGPDRPADEADGVGAGPALLWRAALGHLDDEVVETACLLAWLPPDEIPVRLLVAIYGDAERHVRALEELGLVSFKSLDEDDDGAQAISIHRLYVDAIRRHLRDRDEARRRSLTLVLERSPGRDHLDHRGDQQTIRMIVEQLTRDYDSSPDAGGELASTLRYAARLEELHGRIGASARTYSHVADRLMAELGIGSGPEVDAAVALPGTKIDRDVLAECLHGRARGLFQDAGSDESDLERARRDCELAERLRTSCDDELGAARSRALLGLIQRKQANFLQGDDKRAALLAAVDVIDESATRRKELLSLTLPGNGAPADDDSGDAGFDHPEIARSIFNIGGTRLQLAKTGEASEVAAQLTLAREAYEEALAIRLRIYQRKEHPHIAACRNGLALVAYYRAILDPDLDDAARASSLRIATEHAQEALRVRAELDGERDGADSVKSATLLGKVLVVRCQLASRPNSVADVVADIEAEVETLARVRSATQP